MNDLPIYVSLLMGLATLITVIIFYKASSYSRSTLIILLCWLVLQTGVSLTGFFTVTDTIPPRFLLLVLPPVLFIVGMFLTAKGRMYIDKLDIKTLTWFHVIRIPVEIVLFWLFIYKTVPQLMTFEGRNFDILSGITAPIIYYFVFVKKKAGRTVLLIWNFACLALLINIVAIAVLAAPFPFQKLAFDQPNIAVLYFPFIWLPCCIVPLVLFAHLASIRSLLNRKKDIG